MAEVCLIGVAGHMASGKDSVGEILAADHDFKHVSSSDYLRNYITSQGLGDLSRPNMTRVANMVRDQHGPEWLVARCIRDNVASERLVISGVYSMAEALYIQRLGGVMFTIACPDSRVRFERLKRRGKIGDNVTFDSFAAAQAVEAGGSDAEQNVDEIEGISQAVIINASTCEVLRSNIAIALQEQAAIPIRSHV